MKVTATVLKQNLSKYLKIAQNDVVYITKNGKIIATLSSPKNEQLEILESLAGSIPLNLSEDDIRAGRLAKI
jgi:prevent-host-death family protein